MEREIPKSLQCELTGFDKTADFVKTAIDDEALSVAIRSTQPHLRPRLIKVIKAGLIYFGSEQSQVSVARRVNLVTENNQVKHRRISVYLSDFVKTLYKYCSDQTRFFYGEPDFVLSRPRTQETRERSSNARGGILLKVRPLALKGYNNKEIREETGLTSLQIRPVLRRLRREGVIGQSNLALSRQIKDTLENSKSDFQTKQDALNKATPNFLFRNHEMFCSVPEFLKIIGSKNGHISIDQYVEDLRRFGIATGLTETGNKKRTAVLRVDVNKILVAQRRNGALKTPSSLVSAQEFPR